MTAQIASLDISLPSTSFTAGETIEGVILIKVRREIHVRNILLRLYSEVHYVDNEEKPCYQLLNPISRELWRGVSDCYLIKGDYTYPFYLSSKSTVPPSFESTVDESRVQKMEYFCEVRVLELNGHEHVKRRSIDIRTPCIDWPDAKRKHKSTVGRDVLFVKNLLDSSGCIGATMTVNRNVCRPGSCIFLNVEILNCFRKLTVHLAIVERYLQIQYGVVQVRRQMVYCRRMGTVKSSDAYARWLGEAIWIPDSTVIPYLSRQRSDWNLSYGLFLELRVQCALSRDLSLSLPLCCRHQTTVERYKNGFTWSGAATV